jgi:hypothetical protein
MFHLLLVLMAERLIEIMSELTLRTCSPPAATTLARGMVRESDKK